MSEDDSEKKDPAMTRRGFLGRVGLGGLAAGLGMFGARAGVAEGRPIIGAEDEVSRPVTTPPPLEPISSPPPLQESGLNPVPTPEAMPTSAPVPMATPAGAEQLTPQPTPLPTPANFSLYLPPAGIYASNYLPSLSSTYTVYLAVAIVVMVVLVKRRVNPVFS